MSPPYHYPFLDPPSQGALFLTRLPVPMKRKVVRGGEEKERVVVTLALRSQEYYDVGISPYKRPMVRWKCIR
eukprot:4172365-Pleurochrysis_carterae.AAC.1